MENQLFTPDQMNAIKQHQTTAAAHILRLQESKK